ncbi:MerR family transcriptional regulator [Brevibacillus dissolubilis]|uniref:MerR family transcriptional regulator n=1 Tax=Brevibacillus dissolubilis TaxID=1844116 RepID=UPI0011176001|nr:methyltransferase domain-containing protein [Brevibacillus dissolubilis]
MHIKEISDRLQITPRAIRFYEQKGLLSPAKEDQSGYRTFTEEEAWRLQTIIALREVGMSIDGIKKVLSQTTGRDGGDILPYLELQRSYMYDRWVELKHMIQTTESMIEKLREDAALDPSALYTLAEGNKRLRQTRQQWVDRWDFNRMASTYDDMVNRQQESDQNGFKPHENYEQVLDRVVTITAPAAEEHGLDIGTGTGNLVKRFTHLTRQMSATDQSTEMLRLCKEKNPSVETKLGNFLALPYLDHQFDFVVSTYALHHLTEEQKVLALTECKRVLKPGGRFAIADLMFADEASRSAQLDELKQRGEHSTVESIEDEHYADRTRLSEAARQLGFTVQVEQLTPYVHLVVGWLK